MAPALADRTSTRLPARFQPPAGRPDDLRRQRLHHLIARDPAPVTLVCGPAGAGKTTLLSSWAASLGAAGDGLAWLSLDRHDRQDGGLWAGILAALLATGRFPASSRLHHLRGPPREVAPAFVEVLAEQIAGIGEPLWLVLDDLHVLEHEDVFASLQLLVGCQPSALRLVLSSRTDPPVGLPRLRLEGRLRELRAAELAFTLEETARLLRNQGITVSDASVRLLHARTEGWAAGIRIATLALAVSDDPGGLIARFSGDDHAVADYFASEVLAALPARTRAFLLDTSICSTVDVELAWRLTEREDAAAVLDSLERQNLFTTRSGRGRDRYRYHELLRTYLAAELRRTSPREQRHLHTVTADWLVTQDEPMHAMSHLLRAERVDRLVELASEHGLAAILDGRAERIAAILARLDVASRKVPELALLAAVAAIELDDLDTADRWLAEIDVERVATGPDQALATLAAAAAVARARYTTSVVDALRQLEATDVDAAGSRALELFALHQRGTARCYTGAYEPAVADLTRAADLARADGRDAIRVACLSILAGAYLGLGRTTELRRCAAEAIELAERRGWARSRLTAHAHIMAACAADIQGDRAGVETHAELALASLGRHIQPDVELAAHSLQFILAAHGRQPYEALQAYRATFQRLAHAQLPPVVLATAAPLIVRICLALGERAWARDFADAASAHAPEPGEPALLRALLLIDAGKNDAARRTLEPIVQGHTRCHLLTTEVRAQLLVAELDHLKGRAASAHEQLLAALDLAAPLSLTRPFRERPMLLDLLEAAQGRFGHHEPFVADLLATTLPPATPADDDARRLTQKEVAVLRDLPSPLTLTEIADARGVSVNTIKTHLRSIYRKLDVSARRDAIQAARRRGLL
jgi:LuxR family transcriptional regulator, maltose regulon positive regulatory protein